MSLEEVNRWLERRSAQGPLSCGLLHEQQPRILSKADKKKNGLLIRQWGHSNLIRQWGHHQLWPHYILRIQKRQSPRDQGSKKEEKRAVSLHQHDPLKTWQIAARFLTLHGAMSKWLLSHPKALPQQFRLIILGQMHHEHMDVIVSTHPPSSIPHARKTHTDFETKRKKKNGQGPKCVVWF